MSDTVTMAIWTLRQVDQVSSLRATLHVDARLVRQGDEAVMGATCRKLGEALKRMAHPFAVDIHEGDLQFVVERNDEPPFGVRVTCRWNPTTDACEMRGGPADGDVWAHQSPGSPLRVPVLESTPWFDNDAGTLAESAIGTRDVVYVLAGWSETHRRWVYEVS